MDLSALFGMATPAPADGSAGPGIGGFAPAFNWGGGFNQDPFNQAVVNNNIAANYNLASQSGQSGVNSFLSSLMGNLQLPSTSNYGGGSGQGAAPTYNNTNGIDPALQTTMQAGNVGSIQQGLGAFIGTGGSGSDNMGYIAGYNLNPTYNDRANDFAQRLGINTTGADPDELNKYLNNGLSNYYSVSGLSGGWDGNSGDPRSAATTLYQNNNGQWNPVMDPYHYSAPTSGQINRETNGQVLTAASMMLPIFGGASGILGAGSSGTLSAGSGLGLTNAAAGAIGSGATNALVNAGTNYLMSGGQGGAQGVLGSLGGSLAGAAGNSLLGNANGLGSMFDTSTAGALGSVYNPVGSFNGMLGQTGAGALSPYASLLGAAGGGGINAQSLSQAGAGLAGGYLAQQLDPRLRGLGSQAGSSLANLFYR